MPSAGIPANDVQSANFHEKIKMTNLQYFSIFMYIWWLLTFLEFFYVESLPNPVAMPELSIWSASKAWQVLTTKTKKFQQKVACGFLNFWWRFFVKSLPNNKHPKISTKRPPVSTTFPSGTQRHHWGIGIPGIPSDLRSRPEQSHFLLGALLLRWLHTVYRVTNGRPHLQLYRKGAYIHYLWLHSEKKAKKCALFDER